MVTFIALVKIQRFLQKKVAGLDEIFIQQNVPRIQYINCTKYMTASKRYAIQYLRLVPLELAE